MSSQKTRENSISNDADLRKKMVDLLGKNGNMTRGDIVQAIQVARSTIYEILAQLMSLNVVEKTAITAPNQKRVKVVFSLKTGVITI